MVKNILWKCNLYIFTTEWGHVKFEIIVELMVEIKLWCLFSQN